MEDFGRWAEGCDCHSWLRRLPTEAFEKTGATHSMAAELLMTCRHHLGINPRSFCFDGVHMGPCPLAGKRAVELACGKPLQVMRDLGKDGAAIIFELSAGLKDLEVTTVMQDYEHLIDHMQFIIQVKLRHWRVLPWLMASVAQDDVVKAREAARHVLQTFDSLPYDPKKHHRITWQWLQTGSSIRSNLIEFASGRELHELPALEHLLVELMLMPTAERCQEADHSILKRYVQGAPHSNGPYHSLALRLPEVAEICATEGAIHTLSSCWSS